MRKVVLVCVLLVQMHLFSGCDYTSALFKDGEKVRKEIEVEAFDKIVLNTSAFLVLTNDTSYNIVIEGLDFILSRLEVTREDNVLMVESAKSFGFEKSQMPLLTVSAPGLNHIRTNFPVQITNIDTLRVEKMKIVISGRGSFTECNLTMDVESFNLGAFGNNVGNHILKGRANSLRIISIGMTSVDASGLEARNVVYEQKSVNAGQVHATDKLTVKMLFSGNVYYSGSPDTTIQVGSPMYNMEMGKVIQLPE